MKRDCYKWKAEQAQRGGRGGRGGRYNGGRHNAGRNGGQAMNANVAEIQAEILKLGLAAYQEKTKQQDGKKVHFEGQSKNC